MRKLIFFLCLCLFPVAVKADCWWPEFKVSYYHFNSRLLRNIYGSGAAFFQGEINYNLCNNYCDNVVLFADAGYFCRNGRSLCFRQRTSIEAVPFTFGVKYNYFFDCSSIYVGAGVRTFIVDIHDHSCFVQNHIRATRVGGVINCGFNYSYNCFVLNPFFEYNFIRFCFSRSAADHARNIYRRDLDLSGFAIGLGIGYAF